jgi:hypothetical protein
MAPSGTVPIAAVLSRWLAEGPLPSSGAIQDMILLFVILEA